MARYQVYRYPNQQIGADYDYMSIEVVEYTPNRSAALGQGFNLTTAGAGADRVSPKGTIILPMPDNIQDSNSVNWESDNLDSLSAKAFSAGMDLINETNLEAAKKRLKDAGNDDASGTDVIMEAIKGGARSVKNSLLDAGAAAMDSKVRGAVTQKFVADGVNVVGANVNAANIISRTSGQVLNPNMELLFKGVTLRGFTYSFSFTPRDRSESSQCKAIINTFKRRMAAKKDATGGGGDGIFIKAPDVFRIKFMSGGNEHPFLYKLKPCALKTMNVVYTDGTPYMTYDDATPVKMRMTLSFQELEPVYSEDYNDFDNNGSDGVGF